MNKPHLAIITLGGTIAMTRQSDPDAGVVPTLTGDALAASVPALADIATISVTTLYQLGSSELQFAHLEELVAVIHNLDKQAECSGVIVTQGTDTLEETAFALDCLLNVSFPVVVTGAMRNPSLPGADGPANLLAAARVATSPAVQGCGTLVVMNDEIHSARFARKTHTSVPHAFTSPTAGPMGWVSEDKVYVVARPVSVPGVKPDKAPRQAVVPLIKMGLGESGELVRTMVKAGGFSGLVMEGTGGGHVSAAMADALELAVQDMPVVFASRTGSGATLASTYGYVGGEIDLFRRGLISAGWLDGPKARIFLTLLLRHGVYNRKAIADAFSHWGGHAD